MTYAILLTVSVFAVLIILVLRGKAAYYRKIFSDDHYAEVGNWLHSVLKLGPVGQPSLDNDTAFRSSAGCALTFTREIGEKDVIHIAISQIGSHTTHAVCNRLAFLLLQILQANKPVIDFYYTERSIHHLLFVKEVGDEWLMEDVGPAVAEMKSYQPLHFRFQSMQ